jgi:hypothetical protein
MTDRADEIQGHSGRESAQAVLRRQADEYEQKAVALRGLADLIDQSRPGPDEPVSEDLLEPALWRLFIRGWHD